MIRWPALESAKTEKGYFWRFDDRAWHTGLKKSKIRGGGVGYLKLEGVERR